MSERILGGGIVISLVRGVSCWRVEDPRTWKQFGDAAILPALWHSMCRAGGARRCWEYAGPRIGLRLVIRIPRVSHVLNTVASMISSMAAGGHPGLLASGPCLVIEMTGVTFESSNPVAQPGTASPAKIDPQFCSWRRNLEAQLCSVDVAASIDLYLSLQ